MSKKKRPDPLYSDWLSWHYLIFFHIFACRYFRIFYNIGMLSFMMNLWAKNSQEIKMAAKRMKMPSRIFELEISLRDIKPGIWCRIAVPYHIKLSKLHAIRQTVFGCR
jgi:hypothetical protein